MNKEKLYEDLKQEYGIKHQDDMYVEENCELGAKIKHFHRDKCKLVDFVREIADNDILKEQFLKNHNCKDLFETEKAIKLLRTQELLKEGKLNDRRN